MAGVQIGERACRHHIILYLLRSTVALENDGQWAFERRRKSGAYSGIGRRIFRDALSRCWSGPGRRLCRILTIIFASWLAVVGWRILRLVAGNLGVVTGELIALVVRGVVVIRAVVESRIVRVRIGISEPCRVAVEIPVLKGPLPSVEAITVSIMIPVARAAMISIMIMVPIMTPAAVPVVIPVLMAVAVPDARVAAGKSCLIGGTSDVVVGRVDGMRRSEARRIEAHTGRRAKRAIVEGS